MTYEMCCGESVMELELPSRSGDDSMRASRVFRLYTQKSQRFHRCLEITEERLRQLSPIGQWLYAHLAFSKDDFQTVTVYAVGAPCKMWIASVVKRTHLLRQ